MALQWSPSRINCGLQSAPPPVKGSRSRSAGRNPRSCSRHQSHSRWCPLPRLPRKRLAWWKRAGLETLRISRPGVGSLQSWGGGLVLRAPDPVQRQCVVYQRPKVHPRKSDLDPGMLKKRKREENKQVMGLFLVICFLGENVRVASIRKFACFGHTFL